MRSFVRVGRFEVLFSSIALLAAILLLALVRCGRSPAPCDVVVSVFPLEQIAREIAGERLAIMSLLPPGASPHTFEPRPADIARVESARLVVRVGAGIDNWAERLLGEAKSEKRALILLAQPPPELPEGGVPDPHIWLDPIRVRDSIVPALAQAFSEIDPEGGRIYLERERRTKDLLSGLDRDIRKILSRAPGRRFISFHRAW
ncbi:MAG: metal ABC transporter substrate-binding protein, partial [Vicinamibacteria bacterium]